MSFQGYLTSIQAKTGKTPEELLALADAQGLAEQGRLKPGVKAGQVIAWLGSDFGLGHGHSMAVYALLSGKKQIGDP